MSKQLTQTNFEYFKKHVYILASVPFLVSLWASGFFEWPWGQEVASDFMTYSALSCLLILLAIVSIKPISVLLDQSGFNLYRRPLIYFAAAYSVLHFVAWFYWGQYLNLNMSAYTLAQEPATYLGLLSMLLLLVLAVTEQQKIMYAMGRSWYKLQRLFPIAVLCWLVYMGAQFPGKWGTKTLLIIIVLLLCWRLFHFLKVRKEVQEQMTKINPK